MISLTHYLILSMALFSIGVLGVLLRRNALIILMSVELMLNAANIVIVAFCRYPIYDTGITASEFATSNNGMVFVFLIMTVAAAEVGVGLGIIINLYRQIESISIESINIMKG